MTLPRLAALSLLQCKINVSVLLLDDGAFVSDCSEILLQLQVVLRSCYLSLKVLDYPRNRVAAGSAERADLIPCIRAKVEL